MELNTKSPEYWWADGTHAIFNKYYLDIDNHIVNRKTNKQISYKKNKKGYYSCTLICENGCTRTINIGRMLVSTFDGRPESGEHTADHMNRKTTDDCVKNIKWATKSEQRNNQAREVILKTAFLIVRDGVEKTSKEWVEHMENMPNHLNHKFTDSSIKHYARNKQHGFSYKEYHDLPGEIWKNIVNSKNSRGYWKISDMNRVKYVTTHAENVLSGNRLSLNNGYPIININGKQCLCHILSYKTFFPDEYATKEPNEIILHENDERMDFRPQNLRLGTFSQNLIDAHDNGCYDGTTRERKKCTSYINGIREKDHESQTDAITYLKSIGFKTATKSNICQALAAFRDGKVIVRYARTWQPIP